MENESKKTASKMIASWDFKSETKGDSVLTTPIPMSYSGKGFSSLDQILAGSSTHPSVIMDGKTIFCLNSDIALALLDAGHKLQIERICSMKVKSF